ncbi:MAG: hypothetical protein RKO66_03920 [Candidatus Contendobacter sp.]|nr:hypothetical protein [Candidatus Contendobacter sp.]MDS4058607.1 hypothetical protein [Candidatus Contendobacter sp.]
MASRWGSVLDTHSWTLSTVILARAEGVATRAVDRGEGLPPDRRAELDRLVEAELAAAQRRTMALPLA